jgi:hypothetical protein
MAHTAYQSLTEGVGPDYGCWRPAGCRVNQCQANAAASQEVEQMSESAYKLALQWAEEAKGILKDHVHAVLDERERAQAEEVHYLQEAKAENLALKTELKQALANGGNADKIAA